jgi:hypothetical protein
VALHAQIAEEAGEFGAEDVYDHVNRKLVRRHPHVFGNEAASTPEDVMRTWQGVKDEERRQRGKEEEQPAPFDRLPRSMPVLTRVARLASKQALPTPAGGSDVPGERLLAAVEALLAAGLDPERELEGAVRRRFTDAPE